MEGFQRLVGCNHEKPLRGKGAKGLVVVVLVHVVARSGDRHSSSSA